MYFGYLREPLCYMPCYWLTTLLFSFGFWMKTGVGIPFVYTFLYWARLFLLGLHPLIESSPSECFELCHGHGLWIRIIVKVVCNHCWEIYVDNCRLSFIRFSRMYEVWWKSCLPLMTLRGFLIWSSLGISISQSLCALLSWVVTVFHPRGVYYPFCVYQREVDLHLLILSVFSSVSFVACKKLNPAVWLYFSPSCFQQGVEWFCWYTSTLSGTLVAGL